MMAREIIKGDINNHRDRRIAIIAARFNAPVVDRLIEGALAVLKQHGIKETSSPLIRVPGAYELPLAAQWVLEEYSSRFPYFEPEAIIALGAVIRGETPHFDYVCSACERGLQKVSLRTNTPVIFGVLTTDNAEQAFSRADTAGTDKGGQSARDALEMISLQHRIRSFRQGHLK